MMICSSCNKLNDMDAVFCIGCGRPLSKTTPQSLQTSRQFLYIVILIAAIAAALGIGYYRFILPDGIAAVVNGEEIRLSELEAELARLVHERGAGGRDGINQEALRRLRYEALTLLIRERLLLQEARKAGVSISNEEIDAAEARTRQAWGMTDRQFDDHILKAYGGKREFRNVLRRRMLIDRFISQKIIHGISTRQGQEAAFSKWFSAVSAGAQIRISLPEQWAGAGCCSVKPGAKSGGGEGS